MNRRHALLVLGVGPLATLATFATLARAHHGWSSFDQSRSIYLQGKVGAVKWANPHAEMELMVSPDLALPGDLANRPIPAQSASVDGKSLLSKATVPARKDKVWRIELAPLSRMEAWKIDRLTPGEPIEVVGFTFPAEKGEAILRADFLFRGGKAYALRSSPA